MAWVALGALSLIGVLALLRAFAHASPQAVKATLAWLAGAIGLGVLVLLLATGRAGQAFWALALFGPLIWRWWKAWRLSARFRGAAGPGAGGGGPASEVETAMLALALDHATGRMTGRVRRGRFAGADLADLDLPQLLELMAECAAEDAESLPLLEAWLDRAHPDWREAAAASGQGAGRPAADGPMGRAEALAVLGLAEGATEEEIRQAHRRLMRGAHPDQGGSAWLAARVNQARDVLLKA